MFFEIKNIKKYKKLVIDYLVIGSDLGFHACWSLCNLAA